MASSYYAALLTTQPEEVMDLSIYPLWSTHRWAAGTVLANQVFRMFACSAGTYGQGFTEATSMVHTNARQGGITPNGQGATVTGVGVELFTDPTSDSDLQALAAAHPEHMDDLRTLVTGVWSWDFVQMTLPGGPLLFPGTPQPDKQHGFPPYAGPLAPSVGYVSSLTPYAAHLPPHPFSWGTLVSFSSMAARPLKRDAYLRMTLFLKFDAGVTANDETIP